MGPGLTPQVGPTSGCGSVWLERRTGGAKTGGSNPPTLTMAYETAATRRAKYATALVPRLVDFYLKGDLEQTAMTFAELVRLYPKPRFFLSKERGGLCVYVDEGGYKDLPKALLHAAVYIEEERGEAAFVHKNREGPHGHIEES